MSYAALAAVHGEPIVLHDVDGSTNTTIEDALVTTDNPSVTLGDGISERSGILRIPAEHETAAQTCNTVTLRGEVWHIVAQGTPWAGRVRIELVNREQHHTNVLDLHDRQTVWGDSA